MNIVNTIRKLIAHQKSASAIGQAAEAQAFAVKVAALLKKYRLTLADVFPPTQETIDPLLFLPITHSNERWRQLRDRDQPEGHLLRELLALALGPRAPSPSNLRQHRPRVRDSARSDRRCPLTS